jgi:hypothetical protein
MTPNLLDLCSALSLYAVIFVVSGPWFYHFVGFESILANVPGNKTNPIVPRMLKVARPSSEVTVSVRSREAGFRHQIVYRSGKIFPPHRGAP